MTWWRTLARAAERAGKALEHEGAKLMQARLSKAADGTPPGVAAAFERAQVSMESARKALISAGDVAKARLGPSAGAQALKDLSSAEPALLVYEGALHVPAEWRPWDVIYDRSTGKALMLMPGGRGILVSVRPAAAQLDPGVYRYSKYRVHGRAGR